MQDGLIQFPRKNNVNADAWEPEKMAQLKAIVQTLQLLAEQSCLLSLKASAVVAANEAARSAFRELTDNID